MHYVRPDEAFGVTTNLRNALQPLSAATEFFER